MPTVYEMVRAAVLAKQVVVATYHGHRRLLCPHTLGKSKCGKEQGLFYQFGGTSSSGLGQPGSPENWRCLLIADMREVEVIEGDWHTARRHTRPQTCVSRIDVEVDY